MQLFSRQVLAYAFLVPLVLFVLYRGVVPALTQIDTDFPNYYTAAKIVVDGRDVGRLYDDVWFQKQIHSYGIQLPGKFSPFPPATALVFVPLSVFDPLTALRITTIINLGLIGLSTVLLGRLLSLSLIESTVFILLSGIGLVNCLRFGQLYIALSWSIIFGYYAFTLKKPILAGICFGLFIPIKYFPIIFIVYFAFRREWRVVASGVVTALVITIVSIAMMGWEIHREFLSSVIGNHLGSHLSQQDPFSSTFQSWDSLLRRLLVFDPVSNPDPLVTANRIFPLVKAVVLILLATGGILSIYKMRRSPMIDSTEVSIGILGILGLLLAPATATYHFLLLWLPVALTIGAFLKQGRIWPAYALLVIYSAMGFIPYSGAKTFDGRGLLTLLAYPRLFALLAMFMITQYVIWNRTSQSSVSTNSNTPSL